MNQVSTVCADCYNTCSLKGTLGESEQILSIKGDPANPITQDFTCPRDAIIFNEVIQKLKERGCDEAIKKTENALGNFAKAATMQ